MANVESRHGRPEHGQRAGVVSVRLEHGVGPIRHHVVRRSERVSRQHYRQLKLYRLLHGLRLDNQLKWRQESLIIAYADATCKLIPAVSENEVK